MRLRVIDTGEPQNSPVDACPVVLLHGLFGAAANLGRIQRHLAPRLRVLAMDLRNHGASPHAPGMDYDTLASDVAQTLNELGIGPVQVMGHSMGGKVAMRLALTHPALVARLAVADIAPRPYGPHFRPIAKALQDLPLPPGLRRSAADQALATAIPDRALRLFLLHNLETGAHPHWRIGLENIAAGLPQIETWDALPTATCYTGPTLFIAGDQSDYIRPQDKPALHALFPAARMVRLKQAGHWLHTDAPEAFNATLEAFFIAPLPVAS